MTVTYGPMHAHRSWPDMLSQSVKSLTGIAGNCSKAAAGSGKDHVFNSSTCKKLLPTSYSGSRGGGGGGGSGNITVRLRGKQMPRNALLILSVLSLAACMFSSFHLLLGKEGSSSPADKRQPLLQLLGEQNAVTAGEPGRPGDGSAAGQQDRVAVRVGPMMQHQQQGLPLSQQVAQTQQHQQQSADHWQHMAYHIMPHTAAAIQQQTQHNQHQQEQQRGQHDSASDGRLAAQQQWHQQTSSGAQAGQSRPQSHQAASTRPLTTADMAQNLQAQTSQRQRPSGQQGKQHQQWQGFTEDNQMGHKHSKSSSAAQVEPELTPEPVVAAKPDSNGASAGTSGSASHLAPGNSSASDDTSSVHVYINTQGGPASRLKYPVWWHGPIWAGSGYGSEAINYLLSLLRTGSLAPADLWISHHGDASRDHVVAALSSADRTELEHLQSMPEQHKADNRAAIVVCHSMSTNWAYPWPMWSAGAECPPNPREFGWLYAIGRTMFETDRVPPVFVPRMNAMNEIWVPSEWQKQSFIASGVAAHKLVVVPEGINTTLYDPAAHTPLQLEDTAQLVFGKSWRDKVAAYKEQPVGLQLPDVEQRTRSKHDPAANTVEERAGDEKKKKKKEKFTFISSFKWEQRKGWDILLQAYLSEFTAADDVELFILTKPYESSGSSFKEKMRSWADTLYGSHSSQDSAWQAARIRGQLPLFTARGGAAGRGGTAAHAAGGKLAAALGTGPGSALVPKRRPVAEKRRLQQQQQQQQDQAEDVPVGGYHHLSVGQGSEAGLGCTNVAELEYPPVSPMRPQLPQELPDTDKQADWAEDGLRQSLASAQVHEIIQEIKQFASSIQSVSRSDHDHHQQHQQQQRSLLLRDSAAAAAAAGSAAGNMHAGASAASVELERSGSSGGSSSGSGSSADSRTSSIADDIAAAAESAAAKFPTLYVVDRHISDTAFPRFYKAGDAFVLPSRGEGWGRPHVEAMSMGLPVISTNWSGITAYLNESVGYPLAVEKLVQVEGGSEVMWWFRGLRWAQPSVPHLRQLMRHVYTHRDEAAAKGAAARALMVEKYSPEGIAAILVKEFKRIESLIP